MMTLPYLIAIPLAGGFLCPLFARKMKAASDVIACAATLILFCISCGLALFVVKNYAASYNIGSWVPPYGIQLRADSLSALMLVVSNFIGFAIALYSAGYIQTYTDKWKYYALFLLMMAGVNGFLITSDIFNMFVFLEIASISVYALIAFGAEPNSLEASFKYAVMGTVASAFILLGIAFLYSYTSTLNMSDMARAIALGGENKLIAFVSMIFIMGFGLKSAAVPFHAWLPDTYSSSPATIPAASSGILIKALGLYALARIFFNVFGMGAKISYVMLVLAVLSMVVGSMTAFGQTNIRRLLGYSSISQIGYILLGFGVGTPLAVFGSLLHIFNHSAAKASLFLNCGIVENAMSTNDITKMSGILKKRPVSGYSMTAAALSICGVPPLGGFWSKLIIIFACVQAGRPILAFLAASVAALTVAYYFKSFTPAIFSDKADQTPLAGEGKLNIAMNTAVIILTLAVLLGGLALLPGTANSILKNASGIITHGSFYQAGARK